MESDAAGVFDWLNHESEGTPAFRGRNEVSPEKVSPEKVSPEKVLLKFMHRNVHITENHAQEFVRHSVGMSVYCSRWIVL